MKPWMEMDFDIAGIRDLFVQEMNFDRTRVCTLNIEDVKIAKLIAAAPELLEALKTARQYITQLADTIEVVSPGKVKLSDFLEPIEKAIARAKGES